MSARESSFNPCPCSENTLLGVVISLVQSCAREDDSGLAVRMVEVKVAVALRVLARVDTKIFAAQEWYVVPTSIKNKTLTQHIQTTTN